ncbi:MAG: hypothetical protein WA820_16180, partial [Bradyrhizobium sp.]
SHASRQALKPLSTNGLRSSDGRSVKPPVCAFWQILQTQEHEGNRKTFAQGMPADAAYLW